MKKTKISLFLFIVVKLCTVSALCSSALFNDSLIYDIAAKFLYSGGINEAVDAKNYARLNEAAAGNAKARQALEESYQNGHIQSLEVSFIAPGTACVDGAYMDKLARLHPKLTRLDFFGCHDMIEETLNRWLDLFPKVTSLILIGCRKINGDFVWRCEGLQEVDLRSCNITSDAIIDLAERCPGLRVVDLSCNDIRDASVIALAQNCPELQMVNLSSCYYITDTAVIALAKACPKLQMLHISGRGSITTDAAVHSLAEHCKELRGLRLSYFHIPMDAAVIALAKARPKLQMINLHSCKITVATIITLSENCPELREVRLPDCMRHFGGTSHLAAAAVITLSENCPELREVSLSCWGGAITDAAVIALAENCPKLQEVDLTSCQGITKSAKNVLKQKGIKVLN